MTAPPAKGPVASARALGATLLALLRVRAELFALEWNEEAERRKRLVVLTFVAVLFLVPGLLLGAMFFVVLLWDSYRLHAVAGFTLAYLGVGIWAFMRLRGILRDSPAPFSATLKEFEDDLAMLRDGDE